MVIFYSLIFVFLAQTHLFLCTARFGIFNIKIDYLVFEFLHTNLKGLLCDCYVCSHMVSSVLYKFNGSLVIH